MFYFSDNKDLYKHFLSKPLKGGGGGGGGGGATGGSGGEASGASAGSSGGGSGSGPSGGSGSGPTGGSGGEASGQSAGISGGGSGSGPAPAGGSGGGGIPPGADPTASGDPTSAGFGGTVAGGSVGEGGQGVAASAALGTAIGQAVLAGTMTAEQGNTALAGIGQQNSGLSGVIGLAAANTAAALAGIPGALGTALSAISPVPMSGVIGIAGLAAALSGQGMLGGTSPGVGSQAGPEGKDFIYSEMQKYGLSSTQVDNLLGEEDMAVLENIDRTAEYSSTMESFINDINDADTNIEYNHTLADLSGIQMDAQEKELLYAQKEIAIDRAITEIEDTFSFEGESIIAQQIQNLGTNALGGTIGQSFVKRWQEREASAKTGALQDIESSYLAAERQAIDTQKQRQVDIWGKEFEGDKTQAELNLEKAKSTALIGSDWDKAALDRALQERMGTKQINAGLSTTQMQADYAGEANKWSAAGGIAGAVVGSDWFGDAISSIW